MPIYRGTGASILRLFKIIVTKQSALRQPCLAYVSGKLFALGGTL